MLKNFNKRKKYIVGISSNKKMEYVEVSAKSKKEAKNMVIDVLMKCDLFPFVLRDNFKLLCKKIWVYKIICRNGKFHISIIN